MSGCLETAVTFSDLFVESGTVETVPGDGERPRREVGVGVSGGENA